MRDNRGRSVLCDLFDFALVAGQRGEACSGDYGRGEKEQLELLRVSTPRDTLQHTYY